MFDFLKKKIGSWIGKDKKELGKEEKKSKSSKIKKEVKKQKAKQISKKDVKKQETKKVDKKEKILEKEEKVEDKKEIKEEKNEEKGFFSKLFSKKEKSKEETEEVKELEKEKKVEEKNEEEEETEEVKELEKEKKVEEKNEEEEETEEEVESENVEEEETKEEKPNFFSKIFKKITSSELSKEDFNDAFEDLELTLLENNVALEAVDKIKETLEKKLVGKQIKREKAKDEIISALKESILSVLQEPPNFIENIKKSEGVYTAIFFGINGTGKTTSIAKIAYLLKKNNISCVLAAADTFRAASIEQLKTHAEKVGVPIIASDYGSDPTSVIFEARKYAKANNIKVVLADTAGRMYTKDNLIKEMEKIIRINQPNLKIFVGESITGNDAIDQVRTFNEAIGIDGIILSKADIDEKAGTILSVSHVTNKPIYFLGTGQNYEDIVTFSKKEVLKNLGLE